MLSGQQLQQRALRGAIRTRERPAIRRVVRARTATLPDGAVRTAEAVPEATPLPGDPTASPEALQEAVATKVPVATTAPDAAAPEPAPKNGYKDAVLFQAFGWDSAGKGSWYKHIESKLPEIKAAGCTHIWLPPPSQSVSAQGYLPGQLYNLNSKYGGKEELKALLDAIKREGMTGMADIVINHRCADEQVDGVWNKFRDDVDHNNRPIDWGRWAITSDDPAFKGTGNPDTGADYGAAPDLDHANPDLRAALVDWLRWLQEDIGFGSWRLDFVKGYGAEFVDEYISKTIGKESLHVGEYWVDMVWNGSDLDWNQDGPRQILCDWMNANKRSCCAFDFPTKGILQEAVRHTQYWRLRDGAGKPPGLMGWWAHRAVTFIDNHDTGSTQNHWPFPSDKVAAGYAYIMTHPGMPTIFLDHLMSWGEELASTIRTLSNVRRRNGILSDAKVDIRCADADMYVAVIDDKLTLKMGPRYDMLHHLPSEGEGWKVCCSGPDFCVWERRQ